MSTQEPKPLTSPAGRGLHVIGDASLLTMDRLDVIGRRLDLDPRIASVSLVAHPRVTSGWLRSTGPAGVAVVVGLDAETFVGHAPTDAPELQAWARTASERGLWHDWLLTNDVDVARAAPICEPSAMDTHEMTSPSSSRFMLADGPVRVDALSIAVDATWLQEHQTGAQVLTVAAIEALAKHPGVSSIALSGIAELPSYARHLAHVPKVRVGMPTERSDVVWYPNQIDGRSDIGAARDLGCRVVTTYLDLIAYDVPRYHASEEAWAAYRALQRVIALSVDGITTISADVADRLLEEVPRLDADRVRAIPLGIDHLDREEAVDEAPEVLRSVVEGIGVRPFILVLGNDFRHKNRDFAIRTWQELLRRGVSCDLVLAGLHVKGSSSKADEDALLSTHVDLRGSAHRIGHVSNEARLWLLANASAVHYPSSAEGFGFVPYEAATLGTPTTFTDFGPLKEIARAKGVPRRWVVSEHADDLFLLLTDEAHRSARVADLRSAVAQRTWHEFAHQLVEFFIEIGRMDPAVTSAVATTSSDTAKLAAIISSRSYRAAERLRRLRLRRG